MEKGETGIQKKREEIISTSNWYGMKKKEKEIENYIESYL